MHLRTSYVSSAMIGSGNFAMSSTWPWSSTSLLACAGAKCESRLLKESLINVVGEEVQAKGGHRTVSKSVPEV